jgi:hypothetical protein
VRKRLVVVMVLVFAAGLVFAGTDTPVINARQQTQKARIAQGVASGALTKKEAKRLKNGEKSIQADKKAMKSSGKITKTERKYLKKRLNNESKKIYRLKHNDKTVNNPK